MSLVYKANRLSNPGFHDAVLSGHSSRSDRFLVSNPKSCPATAETRPSATEATADVEIRHEHERRWTKKSVS